MKQDARYQDLIHDAQDLRYLLEHYMDVREIQPRQDDDVWTDDITYEQAGALLLGRHMALIAMATTRQKVEVLLKQETDTNTPLRLAETMIRDRLMLGQSVGCWQSIWKHVGLYEKELCDNPSQGSVLY